MKKSSASDAVDVEFLKAVAQAWHAQSGNPRPSPALEAAGALPRSGAARHRPSRFKLEAMAAAAAVAPPREAAWDFAQSLWDTYELVAVARKLESGLVIADQAAAAAAAPAVPWGAGKRVRESRRRLRSLFLRSTSRRLSS
ncbi:unnamed protein product [Urochloa decumbens]|uniref:Uncharacterized protein n=1 Tax=Urochloa decumbens TaxID=240449 RepID=A0ABC9CKS7_9POAL